MIVCRNCEFYIVGAGCFLHTFTYSWLLFWDLVKLFESSLIFWGLLLIFVRWDQVAFGTEVLFPTAKIKFFWGLHPFVHPMCCEAGENISCCNLCGGLRIVLPASFWCSFPQPQVDACHAVCWSGLTWGWKGAPCRSPEHLLRAAVSSQVLSPVSYGICYSASNPWIFAFLANIRIYKSLNYI